MVYRIILTQPLAAGPDGDWEFDLLMEAKPVSPTGSPLSQVVREMANAPAPAAAEPASADAQADEDMTVSDDDEFEDDSKREGAQRARTCAPGPESIPDRELTGTLLAAAAVDGVVGVSKVRSFAVRYARAMTTVPAVLPSVGNVPVMEVDHSAPRGPGLREVEARGSGDREPMSPDPRPSPASEGMLCSPESAEAEPDDDADSSFDGSPGDGGDGSSSEDDPEEDEDGYEPEVPFPPCSLMHQMRKTYKDSLCKECYHTYVSRSFAGT